MKITTEIEDPPSPPKHHEWEARGYGWKDDKPSTYARYLTLEKCWENSNSLQSMGNTHTYYLEAVRTHYDDGVPIELSPFPTMPDHVERVEYFGTHMELGDMGDADNYITCYVGGTDWRLAGIKYKYSVRSPVGSGHHYARVFYKKEKPAPTELSDLLGEDGQMTAYLLSEGGSVFPFVLCQITEGNWTETFEGKETSWKKRRWSHSPFTCYADANPFIFE